MPGMLKVGADRLLSDEYDRAGFLPVVRHKKTGKREWGVPQVGKDILDALMLPGEVYQGNVSMYGEDGRTSPQAIQGAANMGGMLTVGAGALPAQKNTLRMGIKAYHGSPHDFDRFSMDKIGTGEGAQAYGHGLYFAENEGVAKQYRDNLSGLPTLDGNASIFSGLPWTSRNTEKLAREALQSAAKQGLSGDDAVKAAIKTLTDQGNAASSSAVRQPNYDAANTIGSLLGKKWETSPGRMYEVNINADPNDFLDWDKPLSEQPVAMEKLSRYVFGDTAPTAKGAIEASGGAGVANPPTLPRNELVSDNYMFGAVRTQNGFQPRVDGPDGQRIYRDVTLPTRGDAVNAGRQRFLETLAKPKSPKESEMLREAGIPGIKYLDAGSRGAGDGSRNYVVFDDKLISIVKKYGVAALVSAGVLSQADAEALAAQGYN